jgi:hypothetical protein
VCAVLRGACGEGWGGSHKCALLTGDPREGMGSMSVLWRGIRAHKCAAS